MSYENKNALSISKQKYDKMNILRKKLRNVKIVGHIGKLLVYKDGNKLGKKKAFIYMNYYKEFTELKLHINSTYGFMTNN